MPTFRCTAECANCGTSSGPQERTRLDFSSIASAIDEAAANGYRVVVFSGGEPTLAGDELLDAIRRAALLGLRVRIVTNGSWATDDRAAVRRTREFVEAGLAEVNFSTGDEHARFVPVERVMRGARAAAVLGLDVLLLVELARGRAVTRSAIEAREDFARIARDAPHALVRIEESPWSPLSADAIASYPDGATADRGNVDSRGGCENLFETTTVQADGTISPCCGLGIRRLRSLRLGRIGEVALAEADARARADPLLRRIHAEGPERLLARAAERDPSISWEGLYAHRCQACIRVLTDAKVLASVMRDRPEGRS